MANAGNHQTSYPVAHQFSIGFNPVEDRLVLTTELKEQGHTTLLLTRRMVLLMLKQMLNRLPGLTGLDQTPARYWQEVLQLTHQQAVEQHRQETEARHTAEQAPESQAEAGTTASATDSPPTTAPNTADTEPSRANRLFLATELTCQQASDRLHLAFRGLPMPEAMLKNGHQRPVLALSLEATHVHQVLQLLITHATKANWHLPVDLPWANTSTGNPPARAASH
ncbi:hypothetical protein [Marinobacter sp. S6332]|uniref:hypothetical protein n=1 Tax=Marinobacter sp. S6332 TaxID=2926403 RepID=UPI001FF12D8E|nr:hypothetical protein [Marinobacter sp. S6332]MCK0163732.1 hypothetical protein [Marinobacter sp. S6332]